MGPPLDYWFQGLPTSAVTAIAVTTAATTTTTRMKLRITRENTESNYHKHFYLRELTCYLIRHKGGLPLKSTFYNYMNTCHQPDPYRI